MSVTSLTSSTSLTQLRQLQQAAMFKTADADGDGQLSQSEFSSIGQNVQGSGGHKGPPPMRGGGGPGGNFAGDTLSDEIDADKVQASCRSGLLELTLPFKESARPRRIEIGGPMTPREFATA